MFIISSDIMSSDYSKFIMGLHDTNLSFYLIETQLTLQVTWICKKKTRCYYVLNPENFIINWFIGSVRIKTDRRHRLGIVKSV
jgi:hypothetical protein